MVNYTSIAHQSLQDIRRRNAQEKAFHYYNGNSYQIKEYLKEALALTFNSDDITEMQLDWINITKKLVNQLSVIYREPAQRKIIKGGSENEELTNYYNSILPVNINSKDNTAYRLAKLFNTSLTRVYLKDNKIDYLTLPSYLYDIETDEEDFYKLTQVSYKKYYRESNQDILYRVVWTDTMHYRQKSLNVQMITTNDTIETWGDAVPIPGNPKMINPFKIVPFAVDRIEEQGEDFWGEGMNDVVENNEKINFLLTDLLNEQIILGSVGTVLAVNLGLATKQDDGTTGFKKVHVGRKHPLVVEDVSKEMADPKLEYVNTDPVIDEIRKTIDWKIKMIALARGLNPNSFLAEVQATSGYSKVLDSLEMTELRKDDIEPQRVFEDRRFDITRKVNNYYAGTKEGGNLSIIPDDVYLKVDFAEISQPKTVEEQIKIDTFELDENLTNVIAIAKRGNPDLEDDEVEDQINANKEINERLRIKKTVVNKLPTNGELVNGN